ILRGVRQQQDEPGRFSICSRQAAVVHTAGLERLMGILEAKARERGTVMIISHKEMKSWFRETITVEVKEGRSYVV
ncbi:hypothetical protein NBE51_17330, partial [Salmonella sp. C3206]|uniref:hypothetical protein n=1 Tax=Salmonella sp. C3206 TaxID=2947304 RepID=UPI003F46B499